MPVKVKQILRKFRHHLFIGYNLRKLRLRPKKRFYYKKRVWIYSDGELILYLNFVGNKYDVLFFFFCDEG